MVGLVIAERCERCNAVLVSLMVSPEWRQQGIGTRLVAYLSQFLQKEGIQQLAVRYQAPLNGISAMSRLLKRLHWRAPKQDFLLLKGQSDQLAAINWPERFPLPDGYMILPWASNHTEASKHIDVPAEFKAVICSHQLN
jgi:ribosomal protein S18 acetylase RimI-like enzyme